MADFAVQLDPVSWRAFQRDLRQLEPETHKQLNKTVRKAAGRVATKARSNADWSSRIPGAITVSVTTKAVSVRARSGKAPHARPLEGPDTFRHPVFGNREVWVTQSARPFIQPAVESESLAFFTDAQAAVNDAAGATGWR